MVNSTHRLRQYHPLVEVIITVYCYTLSHLYHTQKKKVKRRVVRPLPDSGLRLFGQWITQNPWSEVSQLSDPSDKCSLFFNSVLLKLNKYLPIKEVELNDNDKEWMSPQLKTMFSNREKAFQCKEKPLWRRLRNKINRMIMYNKNR